MTSTGTARLRPAPLSGRLIRLHLVSRQVPAALAVLVGCAVAVRLGGQLNWFRGAGPLAQQIPVLIEAAVAAVIAAGTRSPFGESELAGGRLLPALRAGTAVALTGVAIGVLAVGAAGAQLPGGTAAMGRNVIGLTGLGLATAGVLGAGSAWVGTLGYAAVTEYALTTAGHTPWIWPARPPHDRGAAICAGLVFVAGLLLITFRGPRITADSPPGA